MRMNAFPEQQSRATATTTYVEHNSVRKPEAGAPATVAEETETEMLILI
jgi:hypothetical protein